MAGLDAKEYLQNVTALEQLIEEINFQRAKEMRQCLLSKGNDSSFVIVHGTTYWTDLFVRHFLFQVDRSTDADDLLFFIRKRQVRGSRYIPKYQTDVEVYRKDSRKLPIGDPDVDWEETVYLNLIIHQFDYTLTLAVCTRTSPKELQVLKRHSQKVYASPSRRRMDAKGDVEEMTYPNVCFHVDNFDEVFCDMMVRDGEMVCVELVAEDTQGSRQAVIFLGSIRYDALSRVYDARASLSGKMSQRMMFTAGRESGSDRVEFVRMRGPGGKGHAEVAVVKPKGLGGCDTPNSEPGVSLTELWDPDWEDDPHDRFILTHQRRLSDPSSNMDSFFNSCWASKSEAKTRSESDCLERFGGGPGGLCEVEAGDVGDAACICSCCSMLDCSGFGRSDDASAMSEVCPRCSRTLCEGNGLMGSLSMDASRAVDKENGDQVGFARRVSSYSTTVTKDLRNETNSSTHHYLPRRTFSWHGLGTTNSSKSHDQPSHSTEQETILLKEKMDTVYPEGNIDHYPTMEASSWVRNSRISDLLGYSDHTRIHKSNKKFSPPLFFKNILITNRTILCDLQHLSLLHQNLVQDLKSFRKFPLKSTKKSQDFFPSEIANLSNNTRESNSQSTRHCKPEFVHSKSLEEHPNQRVVPFPCLNIPFRLTPDGTTVHFLSDLKLDDGAYNPLWTMKGFTQTFHLLKENRRAQSTPLNAYLTYVTLPWFAIITDILDKRTGPILTF